MLTTRFTSLHKKFILTAFVSIFPILILSSLCYAQPTDEKNVYNFKIQDHKSDSCEAIFQNTQLLRIPNVTYWVRMLDCAQNYSNADNRNRAKLFNSGNWPDSFVWVILISQADPSRNERKKIINLLERHDVNIPNHMRSLTSLIQSQQQQALTLLDLKEAEQKEITELKRVLAETKAEHQILATQLADTRLKLEHLADIERQLSLRRHIQNQLEPTDIANHATDNNQSAIVSNQASEGGVDRGAKVVLTPLKEPLFPLMEEPIASPYSLEYRDTYLLNQASMQAQKENKIPYFAPLPAMFLMLNNAHPWSNNEIKSYSILIMNK